MATLQAKKIAEALAKARGVGQVEEDVDIAGCHVSLRSLRPEEYELVHADCAEKEDLAYLNAYRIEHLARSVVEVNGVDFRSVDSVEVEVEQDGRLVGVAVEKHEFIRDHVLSTWSREAVDVAFRKFNDVVAKADRVAADGVKFDAPDETAEAKYRRLMAELREVEGELPMDLAARLLEENGYTRKVTTQDFQAAEERLRNMATVQEAKVQESKQEQQAETPSPPPPQARPVPQARPTPAPVPQARPMPVQPPPQPVSRPAPEPVSSSMSRPASPEELMRLRQPIHGQPGQMSPTPAGRSGGPPSLTRSQQIAMEEGFEDDPNMPAIQGGTDIPELQPQPRLDPKAAASILDRPPTGGRNPRFKPPPGMT